MTVAPDPLPGGLRGRRVLVPRGGAWGRRVAGLLAGHGAAADVVDLVEFAPPADTGPVDAALRALGAGEYAWVVVTSGTTVGFLAARAPHAVDPGAAGVGAPYDGSVDPDAPAEGDAGAAALASLLRSADVAAVGPGTAAALAALGVTPALVPVGERSARGLVAEFPPPGLAGPVGRVLVPHSDLAEPTVVDGLRAAGWVVDDVVAYRTVPGPPPAAHLAADVVGGAVDAVLLTSASTVDALLALVGRPHERTLVCCIGPRTREAAERHGLRVDVVPAAASADELVSALVDHVTAHAADA